MAFSHLLYATFAVVAGAVPNVVSTAAGFATLQTRADVTCDGSLAADGLLMGGLSFTSIDEASGKSQMISYPMLLQQGQVRSPQPTAMEAQEVVCESQKRADDTSGAGQWDQKGLWSVCHPLRRSDV